MALIGGALALNAVVNAPVTLPVLPERAFSSAILAELSEASVEQIGWETFVATVADIYGSLPAGEAARAVLLAENYGQAGALRRYGPRYGLPAVYSGHNELQRYGPPPATADVVIVWTWCLDAYRPAFASCELVATLDNGIGVHSAEQGGVIGVCRSPLIPWQQLWPMLTRLD